MKSLTERRCRSQISFLRRQFLQDDGLPFGDVLSAKTLSSALATIEGGWVDRIYTPVVTLWVFLGQVLSADHSCRAAVARLIAHRVASGERRCSAETGAYCQARKRLPEALEKGRPRVRRGRRAERRSQQTRAASKCVDGTCQSLFVRGERGAHELRDACHTPAPQAFEFVDR